MVVPNKKMKYERQAVMETAKRLMEKRGLSQKQALTEAWKDAKKPNGTYTKTANKYK